MTQRTFDPGPVPSAIFPYNDIFPFWPWPRSPLFSGVIRGGQSTGTVARTTGTGLSRPVFSGPDDSADLIKFFSPSETIQIYSLAPEHFGFSRLRDKEPKSRGTFRPALAAGASTGSTPLAPIGPLRSAHRSPMAALASLGFSGSRISVPGGRTSISTGRAAWKAEHLHHGSRSQSPSGSTCWGAPPSAGAPTSSTSSSTQSPPRATGRISRGAGGTTPVSAPIWRRPGSGGAWPRTA